MIVGLRERGTEPTFPEEALKGEDLMQLSKFTVGKSYLRITHVLAASSLILIRVGAKCPLRWMEIKRQ
jgi:hypothetical protein